MKRFLLFLGAACFVLSPLVAVAQNHGEVGAYADYFRFSAPNPVANYVGVGGRLSINMNPLIALEGEINYDFARNFTTTNTNEEGAGIGTSFVKTSVRPLTGLFGPRFQIGTGAFRAFVTGKVGFINFSTTSTPTEVNGSSFSGAVAGVGGSGTHFAAYPGGGIEGFWGLFGFRADVGDEIFLNNGTYNNFRLTFGPVLRF